jgi:hypothetical protein
MVIVYREIFTSEIDSVQLVGKKFLGPNMMLFMFEIGLGFSLQGDTFGSDTPAEARCFVPW